MSPQDHQFESIWESALANFQDITGKKLDEPNLAKLSSVDDLIWSMDAEDDAFRRYRQTNHIFFQVLSETLKPVELIGNLAAGGASTAFPPSSLVFGAVAYLIKAAKGISTAYDAIQGLFDALKEFTVRLCVYTQGAVSQMLQDKLVQVLSTLISVLALSRKAIKRGRTWGFGRNVLLGNNEKIDAAVARLDKLTQDESRLVGAETLTEAKKVGRTLSGMAATVTVTNAALQDHGTVLESVKVKVEEMRQKFDQFAQNTPTLRDDLKNILKPTVSATDLYDRISRTRVAASGDWIRQEPLFRSWIQKEFPLIWISGNPGAGKSYLAANIISFLKDKNLYDGQNTACVSVGYFFFKDSSPETRSIHQALRDLAHQISQNDPAYAKYLMSNCQSQDEIMTIDSAWRRLYAEYFIRDGKFDSCAYLVLDGIDEAYDAERKAFLELLSDVNSCQNGRQAQIQIALLGRPQILDELVEALEQDQLPVIHVTEAKMSEDITRYIDISIQKSKTLKLLSQDLKDQISGTLSTKAQGMFIWVDFMIQEIYKKKRPSAILDALKRAPKGLNEMLRHVLESFSATLQDEDPDDLNELLAWVTCIDRPLTLGELDTILRLRSATGEGVISLESSLRIQYAAFFTLTREDGLTTTELYPVSTHNSYSRSSSEDVDCEDEGLDDAAKITHLNSNPSSTEVTFCHASIGDFFRNELEGQVSAGDQYPLIGVSINDAKSSILRTCLSLLCDRATMDKDKKGASMIPYARLYWLTRLRAVDRSKIATAEKQAIGRYMPLRNRDVSLIRNWLEDPEVIDTLPLKDRNWIRETAIAPAATFTAAALYLSARWLQGSAKFPRNLFLSLYAIVELGKTPHAEADLPRRPTASDILRVAGWAGYEKNALWYRRVAVTLRDYAHYDPAIEHFEVSLHLEALEIQPDLWQARAGMAGVLFNQEKWDRVIQLDAVSQVELLERLETPSTAETTSRKRWLHNVYERMAKSYTKLNDRENALKSYQSALMVRKTCRECINLSARELKKAERHEDLINLLMGMREVVLREDKLLLDAFVSSDTDDDFLVGCSLAAQATGKAPLLLDVYHHSISFARRKLRITKAIRLELCLAEIYRRDSKEISKAMHIWNRLARMSQINAGHKDFMDEVRQVARDSLATEYLRCALEAAQGNDEQAEAIFSLERLAEPRRNAIGSIADFVGTPHAIVSLGQWYRLNGQANDARDCFKAYMISFLEGFPDNENFIILVDLQAELAFVLLAVGYDTHAIAIYQNYLLFKELDLVDPYDEVDVVKRQEVCYDKDYCPREDEYERHRIGEEGEDWDPGEKEHDDYEVRKFPCSGQLCSGDFSRVYVDTWLCPRCWQSAQEKLLVNGRDPFLEWFVVPEPIASVLDGDLFLSNGEVMYWDELILWLREEWDL